MKWETISGGNEIGILETALPNFAQGEFSKILPKNQGEYHRLHRI